MLPTDEAYSAAWRTVGLTGTEVAAHRYRRAVDAALAVLRPHIEAEGLRKAADAAERITMVMDQVCDDEWRRWMRERAGMLARSTPCPTCAQPTVWIDLFTGGRWAHIDDTADGHEVPV